jgi:hypothetical protein
VTDTGVPLLAHLQHVQVDSRGSVLFPFPGSFPFLGGLSCFFLAADFLGVDLLILWELFLVDDGILS